MLCFPENLTVQDGYEEGNVRCDQFNAGYFVKAKSSDYVFHALCPEHIISPCECVTDWKLNFSGENCQQNQTPSE